MEYISYQKVLPVAAEYDVIVCGGGAAGIGAALAAAEKGAKTALIERFGFLGGMATAGYVNPMSEFAYNGRQVVGGIPWRFAQQLLEHGGALVEEPRCNVSFNPEIYKLVAQKMLLDAGVKTNIHYVLGNNSIDEAIERLKNNDFPKGINAVIFLLHKPVGLGSEENVLKYDDPKVAEFFNVVDTYKFDFKIGFDSCSIPAVLNFTKNIDNDSIDTLSRTNKHYKHHK